MRRRTPGRPGAAQRSGRARPLFFQHNHNRRRYARRFARQARLRQLPGIHRRIRPPPSQRRFPRPLRGPFLLPRHGGVCSHHLRTPPVSHPHPPVSVHVRLELQLARAVAPAPDQHVLRGAGGELHAVDALHDGHRRLPAPLFVAERVRAAGHARVQPHRPGPPAAPDRQEPVRVCLGDLGGRGCPRVHASERPRAQPAPAELLDGDPPAGALQRVRRDGGAVRVCRGRADEAGLRQLDQARHSVAGVRLDDSRHRHHPRRLLGV